MAAFVAGGQASAHRVCARVDDAGKIVSSYPDLNNELPEFVVVEEATFLPEGQRQRYDVGGGSPGVPICSLAGLLGWWDMSEADAHMLRGGWAYLHLPSAKPSYQAHRVLDVVSGEGQWEGRIGFKLQKVPSIKEVPWRGAVAGQNPKHNYRIVEANLPHEVKSVDAVDV